ncbi:MAG: PD40 domain-containing protein [Herpetosiphonaceae bacterium]|nr:PD40 domain-containing protein [Herpetosiphonaceae bacterium]
MDQISRLRIARSRSRRLRRCLAALLLSALAACGGPDVPDSLPTTPPLPVATAGPNEPEAVPPTVVVANPEPVPGKILFVLSGGDIWVAEGDSTYSLTRRGKIYQPTWSPDGTQIAYTQREESFADIWVMNADGRGKIQITNNEPVGIDARSEEHIASIKWAFSPVWSHDGQILAYMSQLIPPRYTGNSEVPQEYPLSLYMYGTRRIGDGAFAGDTFQRVVKADVDLSHPTWSADDSLIVYAQSERFPEAGSSGLSLGFYIPETNVSGDLQGATSTVFANTLDPKFSPDGKWLAYIKQDGGASDVWVVPAPATDGVVSGTPIKLTSEGRVRMPTWSPDSRHLAYFVAKDNLISLTIADLAADGAGIKLENQREIRKDPIDVDSGMSWTR